MTKLASQSFNEELEQKKIMVIVTFPNVNTKKIRICISYPISTLFQTLPIGNKTIFYQGKIIQSEMTFEDYGMTDYDRIAVFPSDQMNFKAEQFWRKATKNDIENKSQILTLTNPLMKKDIAFKHDLYMSRIENNSTIYRNFIRHFQILTTESYETNKTTDLNWEFKDSPNEKISSNIVVNCKINRI